MLLCLLHRNCRREHPHYLLHTKPTEATKDRIRWAGHQVDSGRVQLYRVFHRKRFSSNTYCFLSAKPMPRKLCHLSVFLSYDASTRSRGSTIVSDRNIWPTNFELGLAAASKIRYRVVVAGIHEPGFDWYFRHLQQSVNKSSELRSRVEFLSPNDHDLIQLIQNCSMFLSPRRYSYLGLAALEAMACGKPVIVCEADEKIQGSQVILACGQGPEEWQKAVTRLVKDRELRKAIGEKSRTFVERGHTWKKTVDVMLDSINRTVNRNFCIGTID